MAECEFTIKNSTPNKVQGDKFLGTDKSKIK